MFRSWAASLFNMPDSDKTMKNTRLFTTIALFAACLGLYAADNPSPGLMQDLASGVRQRAALTLDDALTLQVSNPLTGTNGPLASIPQSGSFTNATIEIGVGALISGTGQSVENVIDAHYNLGSMFFFQGEIENAAGATIVDVVGGGFGLRKAGDTYELYVRIEGRRNWIPQGLAKPAWEGVGGVGAGWMPFAENSNVILRNGALFAELNGVLSQSGQRPSLQNTVGMRFLF